MKKIVWMACGMALMCAPLSASANVRYDAPQDSHRRTVCHLADRETAGIASDAGRRETGDGTSWIGGRGSSVAGYGSRVNGILDFPAG